MCPHAAPIENRLSKVKADTNSGAANEKANERKRSALLIKLREEKIENFVKNPSEIRCDIKLEDSGEEMSYILEPMCSLEIRDLDRLTKQIVV